MKPSSAAARLGGGDAALAVDRAGSPATGENHGSGGSHSVARVSAGAAWCGSGATVPTGGQRRQRFRRECGRVYACARGGAPVAVLPVTNITGSSEGRGEGLRRRAWHTELGPAGVVVRVDVGVQFSSSPVAASRSVLGSDGGINSRDVAPVWFHSNGGAWVWRRNRFAATPSSSSGSSSWSTASRPSSDPSSIPCLHGLGRKLVGTPAGRHACLHCPVLEVEMAWCS
uniref:Uncharacterized protein n=1 Tax=Leersia perrieri TaxID=77586 RepID=A0A0D9XSW6_9ORYZ